MARGIKIVYVLSGKEEDFFYEQTLLSLYSLKHTNSEAYVILITDRDTEQYLNSDRNAINQYIDDIKIIDVPDRFSSIQKSRFLKTSLRKIVEGDFLYIDNDTIISGSLEELVNLSADVAAVLNGHKNTWNETNLHFQLQEYYDITGIRPEIDKKIKCYFNGGVIFARDTENAHKFFDKWHELWLTDSVDFNYHKDQPAMWRANYLSGNPIQVMDGTYNCQLIYPNESLKYFLDAKILHYFSSAPMCMHLKIKHENFLCELRDQGINLAIKTYVDNFKVDYIMGLKVLIDNEKKFYDSPFGIMSRKIYRTFPIVDKIAQKIYRLFGYKI